MKNFIKNFYIKIKNEFERLNSNGDSIGKILYYWFPEVISSAMLISLPPIVDSWIISSLHSTSQYASLSTINNLVHLLIKLSQAIPVAGIAMMGKSNGAKQYEKCGKEFGTTFWTTIIVGSMIFSTLYFGAPLILNFMGLRGTLLAAGIPFLKIRAISIFLTFLSVTLFSFMRSVKNTRTPMLIYILGNIVFLSLDYLLVLGKGGFKSYGLNGSAYATIAQYSVISLISFLYIVLNPDYKKYFKKMFINYFNKQKMYKLISLSVPIMIDKGSLAAAYVILGKVIAKYGKYSIASYGVIRDLERFAFLPAVGFAQIIVFLVSNQLGAKNIEGAKSNIKKVFLLSLFMLSITLIILNVYAEPLVRIFDQKGKYVHIAAPALVFISLFVFFDLLQLILAGALRGAGDVKSVMIVRFFSVFFVFVPLVFIAGKLPIENPAMRLVVIYGTFYFNAGFMGLWLLKRFKSNVWEHEDI